MRMSDWSSDVCSSDLILAANGVEIPVSCEQGICGTFVTRVLHGEPDHRDLFMTDEGHAANDQFTPCCPRERSPRLILDFWLSERNLAGECWSSCSEDRKRTRLISSHYCAYRMPSSACINQHTFSY